MPVVDQVPGCVIADDRQVTKLIASWLSLRSHAYPYLGQDDVLFVTLGPNQFA